jgi:hypothetical protein
MLLKLDKDYEDNLIRHGYNKITTEKGFVYFAKGIKDKKVFERIQSIKEPWDISTISHFQKALTEYNLINYLQEIKPFSDKWEYYE